MNGDYKMKQMRILLSLLLVLSLVALSGCSQDDGVDDETDTVATDDTTATDGDTTTDTTDDTATDAGSAVLDLDYTSGLTEAGFFDGVTANDAIDLFDYKNIVVPSDRYTVSDETLQAEIDNMLGYFPVKNQITDRPIVDGDTVNIDYVGSVDGVEFEGGSTAGAGTEVTIGVTSYIDDFLEQLIGHEPGESFDIEVTFPDVYQNEDLQGKDAVFAITINYIVEEETPELTDAFVADNLASMYEWTTVDEMKTSMVQEMQDANVLDYIQEIMLADTTFNDVPESIIEYQERAMSNYYTATALQYQMDIDTFISTYVGYDTLEAMLADSTDQINDSAKFSLVIQAIAEDADIQVTEDTLAEYFLEFTGSEDYSTYADGYGIEYLKFSILQEKVIDYLTEIATLG